MGYIPMFEDFDMGMATPSNVSGMGEPSFGDLGGQVIFNTGKVGSGDTFNFGTSSVTKVKKRKRKKKKNIFDTLQNIGNIK